MVKKKTCIETTHRYSLIAALVFFLIWTLSLCGFGVEHIVIVKRIINVHDLESPLRNEFPVVWEFLGIPRNS